MRTQRIEGFTLIELLSVTIIIALLSTSIPAFSKWILETRQTTQLYSLLHLLELARLSAIDGNKTITLCGSSDGSTCDRDWNSPSVLMFYDKNNDHQYQPSDELLQHPSFSSTNWHWRASAERPYLRFRSDGSAIEWGSFTICPKGEVATGAQIVLNLAGRAYVKSISGKQLQTESLCL